MLEAPTRSNEKAKIKLMVRLIAGIDYDEVQKRFLDLLREHATKEDIEEASDCMSHGEGWLGIVMAAQVLADGKVPIPPDLMEDYRNLTEQLGDDEFGDMEVYEKLKAVQ